MAAIVYATLNRNERVSTHFHAREFECVGETAIFIGQELLEVLEVVRDHFQRPLYINSGYRDKSHNTKVGGEYDSQHLLGIAADIRVEGFTPKEVYDYLNKMYPNQYGLGLYTSFVHIDTRNRKARWLG